MLSSRPSAVEATPTPGPSSAATASLSFSSDHIIPQKRPFEETGVFFRGVKKEEPGVSRQAGPGTNPGAGSSSDVQVSVFPLEDDDDEDFAGHYFAPSGESSAASVAIGPSVAAAPVVEPSISDISTTAAPQMITRVQLVPAGLSKRQKKKLRKEAFSKPLDF